MSSADIKPHFLSVFAGRKGLGNSITYRSSHKGADVVRFHASACDALGVNWGYLYDDTFGLTAEQAAPFLADSDLAPLLQPSTWNGKRYPYELAEDVNFRDFYLHVAAWGANGPPLRLSASTLVVRSTALCSDRQSPRSPNEQRYA